MNTAHSNYTGRAHRDMQSAFGPYTSHYIAEKPEPMHPHDRIVIKVCALAAMAFVAWLFIWGN